MYLLNIYKCLNESFDRSVILKELFEPARLSPEAAKRPSVLGFSIFNSWDWASVLLDFGRTVSMTCHEVLPPRRGCKRVCSNFSVCIL